MININTIAQTIWEYATRTLATGSPGSPSNRAEKYAKAVWEYGTRTLVSVTSNRGISITANNNWQEGMAMEINAGGKQPVQEGWTTINGVWQQFWPPTQG